MRKSIYILTLIALAIGFNSCDKDDDNLECEASPAIPDSSLKLTFKPLWNGEPVESGSEYTDHLGLRLKQFNFKTFISDIRLENDQNEDETLEEIALLNLGNGPAELELVVPNNSNFIKLKFATGIPEEHNVDHDPSTWPNSHPLSVQGAQGMHWGWNTGYIFTMFDGKADTTDAVTPEYLVPFFYHAGADEFYTEHEFDIDLQFQVESDTALVIALDMEKFLNGSAPLDIRTHGQTHTGGNFEVAEDFITNFNESFRLE